MKKLYRKFLIVFFVASFFGLINFFSLQASEVIAAELEVQYPTLQTGATVTSRSDLTEYLKYVFDFGIFVGFFAVFLSLVWAGVLYLISPAKPDALAMAKDRVTGAISGLLILATLYLIITTINPSLAIFKLDELDEIPPPPPPTQPAGVNFYNSGDCSGVADTNTVSIPDLGNLKNKINSVGIVPRPEEDIYYISILYDITNYWGKCQYIDPNKPCSPLSTPFAASASIHKYSFSPEGSVVLYRKPFNKGGGSLQINSSDIVNQGGIYVGELEKLYFGPSKDSDSCTVPKEEQDCALWDNKNKCVEKQCPNLAGENISSIKIEGNYIVILVYFDKKTDTDVSWSYCQEFPSIDDINKNGPQQIKWEAIKNRGQNPNFIVIIPVKQK